MIETTEEMLLRINTRDEKMRDRMVHEQRTDGWIILDKWYDEPKAKVDVLGDDAE